MKLIIKIILLCVFLHGCQNDKLKNKRDDKSITTGNAANNSIKQSDLFSVIKALDSAFFDVAYNKCDTILGRKLISKDFEFYHDKGGALLNEPNELASDVMIEDLSWICNDTRRKLVADKMEVYPLYEEKELYGAIQIGNHQFYKVEGNEPTDLKTNARFIHLWILEENDWKLRRVFSYDHQQVIK